MPVLKSRAGFDLDRRVLRHLLVEAVRTRDPDAGADLHRLATERLGHAPTWDWWLERCADAERRDRRDVALLGVEFALDAATHPWPELTASAHDHLEHLADRLHGSLAASADIAGVDRLRRPDKARIPGGAQGRSATAG